MNYRDADGLRAAVKRCVDRDTALVLINEYRRACGKYSTLREDPIWLQNITRSVLGDDPIPDRFFIEFMGD